MSFPEVVKTHWPIITTVAAGLLAWGALNADVSNLKAEFATEKQERQKMQTEAREDHDAIVRMDERTKTMATDVQDIKSALKEMARK